MKKIISYLIIGILLLPIATSAGEDYLFDGFENSPNSTNINSITDEKTRYCEQTYLEAMRRRPFTKYELRVCKNIILKRLKEELEYKREIMQDRYVY